MKLDASKFLTLTTMLAAPLIAAPLTGCLITTSDDDDNGSGTSNTSPTSDTSPTSGGDPTTDTNPSTSATTATSTTDPTDTTTGGTTPGDGSTDGGTAAGTTGAELLCCDVTLELGCAESPEIQMCVCAEDPLCCSEAWHEGCPSLIGELGCGAACPATGTGSTGE